MAFGYNANAVFGNITADIVDHAKDLLGSLIDKREEKDENLRPIIFIAHCLGGIVVKQVWNSEWFLGIDLNCSVPSADRISILYYLRTYR